MSGLIGEYLKINHRSRVGCHNSEYLSACHFRQGFFCSQDGQRTDEPAYIQLPVKQFVIRIHFYDCFELPRLADRWILPVWDSEDLILISGGAFYIDKGCT